MIDIVLTPRDGLFLKDGREWASSDGGRAHSLGWPAPSTLHGALCTAFGRACEGRNRVALTPAQWRGLAGGISIEGTIALRRPLTDATWAVAHRMWPVPADALVLKDPNGGTAQLHCLDPKRPLYRTLGRDDDPAREALWCPRIDDAAKPLPRPAWWDETTMATWLAEPVATRAFKGAFRGRDLDRHVQVHVGIDPATQAAREQILFAHDVVETIDKDACEWAIGCRVAMNPEPLPALPALATLGGDRRVARLAKAPPGLLDCPAALLAAFTARPPRGLRLIAVTPAAFAAGWLPDKFSAAGTVYRGHLPGIVAPLILSAARIPLAAHVSGWDMAARKPKSTTRLVPPGAVYHLVKEDGGAFTAAEAKSLWLVALGDRGAQGFGRFVPGVWHPTEDTAT